MAPTSRHSRKSRFGRSRLWAPVAALLAQACSQPPAIATVEESTSSVSWAAGTYRQHSDFIERDAHNAVETYRREPDGTIATAFEFRRGAFDGDAVEYRPRGFVGDESPAVWGMQFVWPIKAEYRIVYVAPDYSQTIVGRTKRDYVWLMARTPTLSPADYDRNVERIRALGYDVTQFQRVPQQW